MPNFALPAWLKPNHPIAQRDHKQYQRLKAWQVIRIAGIFIFFLFPVSLFFLLPEVFSLTFFASLFPPLTVRDLSYPFLAIALTLPLTHIASFTFLAIGGARAITAEREQQTWTNLRITGLTLSEIINAKVVSVVRQALPWLIIDALFFIVVVAVYTQSVLPLISYHFINPLSLPIRDQIFPLLVQITNTQAGSAQMLLSSQIQDALVKSFQGLTVISVGLITLTLLISRPFFVTLLALALCAITKRISVALAMTFAAHLFLGLTFIILSNYLSSTFRRTVLSGFYNFDWWLLLLFEPAIKLVAIFVAQKIAVHRINQFDSN